MENIFHVTDLWITLFRYMLNLESQRFPVMGKVSLSIRTLPKSKELLLHSMFNCHDIIAYFFFDNTNFRAIILVIL